MTDWGKLLIDFLRDDLLIMGSIGVGCLLTAMRMEKRSHFRWRVLLSFAVVTLWMLGTDVLRPYSSLPWQSYGIIRYSGLFILFGLSTAFWCRASFFQSLYAVTVAYSIQNMCERLIEIPRFSLEHFPVVLDRFCLFLLLSACLYLYYRLFVSNADRCSLLDFSDVNSTCMLLLGVGVLFISVGLDITMRPHTPNDLLARNSGHIMSALFSLLTIVVSMSHLRESESKKRARITQQLLYAERRRYEQEKQLHDLINVKCHDIRHQIAALGDMAYKDELKKIGRLVDIYDSATCTKSSALDVVLSNKALTCGSRGITLTCLADGQSLQFMEDCDVYALFGNILDNAIEAASKLEDPEKRQISLTVSKRGGFLLIESQNFFSGSLTFENGLPQTTQANTDYHGYGTRSLQLLTERYGGDLDISADGGIFRLSILLPIMAQ